MTKEAYLKKYGYAITGTCPINNEEIEIHDCLKCTERRRCQAEWLKDVILP